MPLGTLGLRGGGLPTAWAADLPLPSAPPPQRRREASLVFQESGRRPVLPCACPLPGPWACFPVLGVGPL